MKLRSCRSLFRRNGGLSNGNEERAKRERARERMIENQEKIDALENEREELE